jgi:putative holliday junction resolvase
MSAVGLAPFPVSSRSELWSLGNLFLFETCSLGSFLFFLDKIMILWLNYSIMDNVIKFLAIDYGAKKIGLAIGDIETKIASPFKILENTANLLDDLKAVCQTEKIDKIVLGVPVGLKGVKSEQYEQVIFFSDKLKQALGIEVIQQDENLSSSYAQRLLQGTKAKGKDDAVAAMLVLQSFFDGMGN